MSRAVSPDMFVVQEVVRRGAEREVEGLWSYDLDGVIVVLHRRGVLLTELCDEVVVAFVPAEVQEQGAIAYKKALSSLETALEPADRLAAIQPILTTGRVFYGLDLIATPMDAPLLQHCAKMGYAECVEALLKIADFAGGLGHRCKHRFTVLHFAAWSGHLEVLDKLGEANVRNLLDIANEFGELPETSAFIRALDVRSVDAGLALNCEEFAVRLRTLRTGCERRGALQNFVEEAGASLALAIRADKVLLPFCIDPATVVTCFGGRRLTCAQFVAQHTVLTGPLPSILSSLQENRNLEHLVFEHCSLTAADAVVLDTFLKRSTCRLAVLSLNYNPLGDEGTCNLAHVDSLGRVQKISLGGTVMSSRGLAALASVVEYGAVENLAVGDNDFEAINGEALVFFTKFSLAVGSAPKLTELDMGKTRLQKAHLSLLVQSMKTAPALNTVKLNQVGMKEEWSTTLADTNPLLAALEAPTCKVTRVEVILVDYPDLFKSFKRSVMQRNSNSAGGATGNAFGSKGFGKGKAQRQGKGKGWHSTDELGENRSGVRGEEGHGKGKAPRKGKGKGWHSTGGLGENMLDVGVHDSKVLTFPMTLVARVRVTPRSHPDFTLNVDLCGDGFIIKALCDEPPESVDGLSFSVRVGLKSEACTAQYGLGSTPMRRTSFLQCQRFEPAQSFPACAGIELVMFRHDVRQVLIVPGKSQEATALKKRLIDFVLSTDYVLQERFGVGGRKLVRQLTFNEVMDGLAVTNFSDCEVEALSKLDDFQTYLLWVDAATSTARHQMDHIRCLQNETFQAVLQEFKREAATRASTQTPSPGMLPCAVLEANRIAGFENQRSVSLVSSIEKCLLQYFVGSIAIDGLQSLRLEHAVAQESEDGRWKHLLLHIAVPENMIISGEVQGLRASAQWQPVWVPLDKLDGIARADSIRRAVLAQTSLTLTWREHDSVSLKVRGRNRG